jgi:hypothetical protein
MFDRLAQHALIDLLGQFPAVVLLGPAPVERSGSLSARPASSTGDPG